MSWTPERTEACLQLWQSGLSAAQVAKRLDEGPSRHAVIGRMWRMGVASPTRQHATRPRKLTPNPYPQKAERLKVVKAATAKGERVGGFYKAKPQAPPPYANPQTILTIGAGMCRWPLGEVEPGHGDEALMCGAPASGTYCAWHAFLAVDHTAKPLSKKAVLYFADRAA